MPVWHQSWSSTQKTHITGLAAFTIAKKPGLVAKYGAGFRSKFTKVWNPD